MSRLIFSLRPISCAPLNAILILSCQVFRFALKVFKDGHKHLWKQEIDAYKTLGDKKGMVHYLGNFSHAPDGKGSTYNILLEYAENDLAEYFHLSSPVLPSHITDFWERLLRIASAIKEFHNFETKRLKSKSTKIKGYVAWTVPIFKLLTSSAATQISSQTIFYWYKANSS